MERSEDYMAKHFSEVKRELEQPDGPPEHISTWNGFATASAMTQPGYLISYETTFPYREDFFSGPAYSVRSLSSFALF